MLAVSDELSMCRVLGNQITYDGKHVGLGPTLSCLVSLQKDSTKTPQELKLRDYLWKYHSLFAMHDVV